MKTITKEAIELFVKSQKLALKASQLKLCVPFINRMYRKMKAGIYFSPVKTDGDILCDGHHRYIASFLFGKQIETVPSIASPSAKVVVWIKVVFEEEEWKQKPKLKC